MSSQPEYNTVPTDLGILRELAERKMDIANDPVNRERKRSWLELHSGSVVRPMVLAEWGGVLDKARPYSPALQCREEWAREIENALRTEIWVFDELQDDHVVEPYHNVRWFVDTTYYRVEAEYEQVEGDHLTAKRWKSPIKNIAEDFHLLKPRTYTVDREKTLGWKAHLEQVFDGILPVRIRGGYWWTMGMTIQVAYLIGLEELMLYMFDDPEGLHRVMRFLCDDHIAFADWLEKEGLLCLNNENDYVGSGSIGYTQELSLTQGSEMVAAQMKDTWVLLESQETVGVGPRQFEEFIFPYQQEIADRFGLVYYGCCEPLHHRWEVLRKMPNLRVASVSPLCNQEIMGEALGNDYVFSRKPNPTLISTDDFNEELIRKDIRVTLDIARRRDCRLEMIMKDVHTLREEPHRLARWVQWTREEIERGWG